jgi:type VI protein secretion system component VasF
MTEAESQTTVETTETLDPERQQNAKEYAQIRRRLFVVGLIAGVVYVLVWILSGLSP